MKNAFIFLFFKYLESLHFTNAFFNIIFLVAFFLLWQFTQAINTDNEEQRRSEIIKYKLALHEAKETWVRIPSRDYLLSFLIYFSLSLSFSLF